MQVTSVFHERLSFMARGHIGHQRCSVKKGVLRNFARFTGKHLCQSLFFNKVAGSACNFIKNETRALVFSCEFCEISKNTFFTEHVWATVSAHYAHWLGISLKVPKSRGGWSEKVTLAKYHIRLRSACNN